MPLAAIDIKEKKVYLEIKIDTENVVKELKSAFSKALPFAVQIGYPTKETIKYLLFKALTHAKALDKNQTPELNSGEEK